MTTVRIEIPGPPVGKGRPRAGKTRDGRPVMYTPDKTLVYENYIKWIYTATYKSLKLCGPLSVSICVGYPVPKSASKKDRARMFSDSIRPAKKPDCDNIAKIILDALNGVAYDDDRQVVELIVLKLYRDVPSTVVQIIELADTGDAGSKMEVDK